MQLWGKTSTGKQRFYCPYCTRTATHTRHDNQERLSQRLFVEWLTGSLHLQSLARKTHTTERTLRRRFRPYWSCFPTPNVIHGQSAQIVVADAISVVSNTLAVLIASDPATSRPINWLFAERESYARWLEFFYVLRSNGCHPPFAVCDGQRGLTKALFTVWPTIKLQRCLVHVVRQAKTWLTRKPQTHAGQELLRLVNQLFTIRTRRQKRRWLRSYRRWRKKYDTFLKERTHNPVSKRRWWYTHRKLRAVRSLITNSLPYLFTFVRYHHVPRTSNHLEGGINSRIKDLLRIHRGLRNERKLTLIAWYLAVRQGQKPTRNVH